MEEKLSERDVLSIDAEKYYVIIGHTVCPCYLINSIFQLDSGCNELVHRVLGI